MSEKEERRAFLKATAAGAVAAGLGATAAHGQVVSKPINPQAKAVMPDGRVLARQEILKQLGLRPDTPPDAWLAIIGCGSNASALRPEQLRSLVQRGAVKKEELDEDSRKLLERVPARAK